jgi:phosphoesterase RecJ-like protein
VPERERASCGEIIYEILMELSGKISAETATPLYVAVSTDTGCFAFGNTTANTLRVASYLVDAGAPISRINKELFRKKARPRIILESLIMGSMEFYYSGSVAVASITKDMMEKAGADEDAVDDIAALPGSIEGVVIGITIRQLQSGSKVSVRTMSNVDANALCAKFGGGGHAMAAGCTTGATVPETKKMLISAIDEVYPGQLL